MKFTHANLLTVTPGNSPIITQCTSILANIDRTGQKMEKYRFVTDSSQPNSTRIDTMWVNQKDYNYINVQFAALFTSPENIVFPKYVTGFKFGIVSGKIQIDLQKVGRNGNLNFWLCFYLQLTVYMRIKVFSKIIQIISICFVECEEKARILIFLWLPINRNQP